MILKNDKLDLHLSHSPARIGRAVGIVLLLQLATALMLPFILAHPINSGSPAFLTKVDAHAFQIRSAIFISFIGSALTLYLGIMVSKILRRYNRSLAVLFLIVCAISCTLDLIHAASIMSMLSISNQFVNAEAPNAEVYQIVGAAVSTARRSAHIMQLLAIGAWIFIFYFSLLRFNLIPRALAAIGLLGIILQFIGVTAMMFLGYPSIGELAMPLLPIQITVSLWLMIKGFKDSQATNT